MAPYGHNNKTKKQPSWNVKEPKLRHDTAPNSRVDLNPASFDVLLEQKGVNCRIYRSLYCPKVKSVDGAEHEIDCDLCNGSGFIDVDPICTKVFVQTQELDKLPNVEGFVDGNTVLMTFPVGVELQYFTRIDLEDFTDIFFQRVLRNPDSDTDVLKYRACNVNVVVDYDGVRYNFGTDFRLDVDGNVLWLNEVQTRTFTFSAVPDGGTWELFFDGESVNTYNSATLAAAIQSDLITATGYSDLTVSGNYSSGFVVSIPGIHDLIPKFRAESELLDGNDSVTVSQANSAVGGRHPAANIPYSIHYEAHQQFRASAASHVNRFTQHREGGLVEFVKMPEQWYCTKEFLPKRENRDGAELEQGPYDNHSVVEED